MAVEIELEKLLNIVKTALDKLYANQSYLIENRTHERSIVFWFGIYFYEILQRSEFAGYDLDFDYNRKFSLPKTMERFESGTYPDIILHKRGSKESNLIIIEFKNAWGSDITRDLEKLRGFTNQDGDYKYRIGLSIILDYEKPNVKKVINGEVVADVR